MAIAFNSSLQYTGVGTAVTQSYTVSSGTNRLLLVGVAVRVPTVEDVVTSVTYNGTAMTKLVNLTGISPENDAWDYIYGLVAPSTGANNVVVNMSNSHTIFAVAADYTGVSQTGLPDAISSANLTGATVTGSVTVVAANSWAGIFASGADLPYSASTGTTGRDQSANTAVAFWGDSNGALSAGSNSMSVAVSGAGAGNHSNVLMVSFAPAGAAASSSSSLLALLGVG